MSVVNVYDVCEGVCVGRGRGVHVFVCVFICDKCVL